MKKFLKKLRALSIFVGIIGVTLVVYWGLQGGLASAQATAQVPLNPKAVPQFVDPMPIPQIINAGTSEIEIHMREFEANVLPTGTFTPGVAPKTWVWGYIVGPNAPTSPRASYLGPIIVAKRGIPTQIRFQNDLGSSSTTNVLAYKNSTDQTLHWADPFNLGTPPMTVMGPPPYPWNQNYSGPIPAAIHLHGGEVPPVLDGGPDAWFTSNGAYQGHGFYSKDGTKSNYAIFRYPNTQEAAPIWFHDHVLGATRLNVYAGLAGGYIITDPGNDPANLPGIVPLIIQDRMFDTNGQLFFPAGVPYIPNPEHPYWVPEFVGDTIAVNGKVWPYFNVEPKRYRFLFLNGSNARTYELSLNGANMYQIGTDGGYLDAPVKIDSNPAKAPVQKLIIMPGERADVIIDFAGLKPGDSLILRNTARTPYPGGAPPRGSTLGQVMQFRVVALTAPDTTYNPALGGALRTPMVRLVNPMTGTLAAGVTITKKRQLTLNEVMGMKVTVGGISYPGGPLEILVNNTKWSGKNPDGTIRPDFTGITVGENTTYYSELSDEGTTEVWEIINLTADAHPIHTHLTQFQILNRQDFDVKNYTATYALAFPGGGVDPMTGLAYPAGVYMPGYGPPLNYNVANADGAAGGNPAMGLFVKGLAVPPAANETGWKDTIMALPGQVTRIVVRYAPTYKALNATSMYFPFDPNGGHGYVWHCHIIDHEDNEMMRPYAVNPNPSAVRTYFKGIDY